MPIWSTYPHELYTPNNQQTQRNRKYQTTSKHNEIENTNQWKDTLEYSETTVEILFLIRFLHEYKFSLLADVWPWLVPKVLKIKNVGACNQKILYLLTLTLAWSYLNSTTPSQLKWFTSSGFSYMQKHCHWIAFSDRHAADKAIKLVQLLLRLILSSLWKWELIIWITISQSMAPLHGSNANHCVWVIQSVSELFWSLW